jgi:hypothetical protein
MVRISLVGVVLSSMLSSGAGCATGYPLGAEQAKPLVRADAERDLDCPPADIRVTESIGNMFEAIGCGQKAVYKANCEGTQCVVHREGDSFVPFRDRPTEIPR